MRRSRAFLALVAVLAATPARARADDATPPPSDEHRAAAAEALFRDGRARMEAGDYTRACPLFAESLRLDASLGALFNLAACEQDGGRLADAWVRFGEAIERMPETDDRRAVARARRAALTRELPWLTVTLAGSAPADARVTRDGVELGPASLGVPLPVDPGTHEVVVRAPGTAARLYTVTIARAERRAMMVDAGVAAGPPGKPPAAAYVLGGVGVASVVTGAVLGVRALQRRADSAADCSGTVCRDAAGAEAYAEARSLAVGADVAFGAGALAIAGFAYLVWWAPPAASVGLRVTPSGVGGSF
jgi:hypothetical protein